jgi:hypothetical protein
MKDVDLTTITTPFGLLPSSTQDALRSAAEAADVETFCADGTWETIKKAQWEKQYTYRIAPPATARRVVVCDVYVAGNMGYAFELDEAEYDFYQRENIPGYAGVRWEGMKEGIFSFRQKSLINNREWDIGDWVTARPLQVAFVVEEKA